MTASRHTFVLPFSPSIIAGYLRAEPALMSFRDEIHVFVGCIASVTSRVVTVLVEASKYGEGWWKDERSDSGQGLLPPLGSEARHIFGVRTSGGTHRSGVREIWVRVGCELSGDVSAMMRFAAEAVSDTA